MKLKNIISVFPLLLMFFSCNVENNSFNPELIYKFYAGEKEQYKIWIVDGGFVRKELFPEFVYGGNNQRYPFIPEKEIWIDNSISSEEYYFTLIHEINECNLMSLNGYSYIDAHDSSLMLENQFRVLAQKECMLHENSLPYVFPIDFDSTTEIESLPDSIRLNGVYKSLFEKRNDYNIFIVDGYKIRREIYPDFGFSGNYLAYKFIPENEIWIDASVSCEEMFYSIILEIEEISFLKAGKIYDDAYTKSLEKIAKERKDNFIKIKNQNKINKVFPPARDFGSTQK